MQEVMCDDRSFPWRGFASLGYEVFAYSDAGSGGVAVVSRSPMTDVHRGLPGAVGPFAEPWFLAATVNGVRVVTVYAQRRKVGTDAA